MDIMPIRGEKDIQKLFEATLDNREGVLRTVLSGKPLVYLAGDGFADEYMRKRREVKIFLKSLRTSRGDVDKPQHKNYEAHYKEARIVPEGFAIDRSVVIWDDTVAIIDTETVSGSIIRSADNARVAKAWFEFVWSQSLSA